MRQAPTPAKGSPTTHTSRDDSSLFSLQSLVQPKANESAEAKARQDDSGLIDLRALAEQAKREEQAKQIATPQVAPFTDAGLFDAPARAPEPAPLPEPSPETPKKRPVALIAGAVALAAVASVAAFILAQSSGDVRMSPGIEIPVESLMASMPAEPPKVDAPKPETPAPVDVKPNDNKPRPRPQQPKPQGGTVVKADPPPKAQAVCDLQCQMEKAVNKPR